MILGTRTRPLTRANIKGVDLINLPGFERLAGHDCIF